MKLTIFSAISYGLACAVGITVFSPNYLTAATVSRQDLIAQADKNGSEFDNPWVNNVVKAFDNIPAKASKKVMLEDSNNIVPEEFEASKANVVFQTVLEFLNIADRMEGLSHIQSVKAIPRSPFVYLTLNHKPTEKAYLVIAQRATTLIASDFDPESKDVLAKLKIAGRIKAYGQDRIVDIFEIGSGNMNHPGGVDVCGKYLAIPLEGKHPLQSRVVFYDTKEACAGTTHPAGSITYKHAPDDRPTKIDTEIAMDGIGCMAVSLARLPNGHYLLGAITNKKRLNLYYSKTTKLEEGFEPEPRAVEVSLDKLDRTFFYQNLTFVTQVDGKLFLIATENTKNTAPIINGEDWMDLFELQYDPKSLASGQQEAKLKFIKGSHMDCGGAYSCNFNAAATINIYNQNILELYATPHWVDDGKITLKIFSPNK